MAAEPEYIINGAHYIQGRPYTLTQDENGKYRATLYVGERYRGKPADTPLEAAQQAYQDFLLGIYISLNENGEEI